MKGLECQDGRPCADTQVTLRHITINLTKCFSLVGTILLTPLRDVSDLALLLAFGHRHGLIDILQSQRIPSSAILSRIEEARSLH